MPGPKIPFPDEQEEARLRDEAEKEIRASIERDKQRIARWPIGAQARMAALAALFPTMRGVPGTNPWNVDDLIAWLNTGAPTSGSRAAAMFLLGVWNPSTNWNEQGVPKSRDYPNGRFDLFEAMGCWDYKHIEAFQEWVKYPFWP